MSDFVRATWEVARKEFSQHLRTKRLLIIGLFLAAFLFLITLWIGPQLVEDIEFGNTSRQHIVLSFYFSAGLIGGFQFTQLLAIVLTADAVCSEWARRTIFLLLSKPVSRAAFVTGKLLGNLVTISATIGVLFLLTYLLMIPLYDDTPSGAEVAGFFGTLGFIILGAAAFASISLFVSTLTRSTVVSLMITLALWLIVFPVLGNIGFFSSIDDRDVGLDDWQMDWSRYLNPTSSMQAGARLLVPDDADRESLQFLDFANIFSVAAQRTWLAALALVGHTVVFYGASVLVVRSRDFE